MLNVGKNGAEKIGVKMAILAGLPRRGLLQISIEWRDLWIFGTVKAFASRERWQISVLSVEILFLRGGLQRSFLDRSSRRKDYEYSE